MRHVIKQLTLIIFILISVTSVSQTVAISDQSTNIIKHSANGDGLFSIGISTTGGINKNNVSLTVDSVWYLNANDERVYNPSIQNLVNVTAAGATVPSPLTNAGDYYMTLNQSNHLSYTHLGKKFVVRLRASHTGPNAEDTASFVISVNDALPPNVQNIALSIPENSANTTLAAIGSTTKFAATDPDGGATGASQLSYSLVGSSSIFEVVNLTGADDGQFSIRKKGGSLNFEGTASYSLTVRATDRDGETADATVTVNVTDVNESPVLSVNRTSATIPENQSSTTTIFDFSVADPDNGQTFNYTIQSQSGGAGSTPFTINSDGEVTVANVNHLDYENLQFSNKQITLVVRVTDVPGGSQLAKYDQRTVTVSVTDVAESYGPSASSKADFTVTNKCQGMKVEGAARLITPSFTSSSALTNLAKSCGYNTAGDVRYRLKRIEKKVTDAAWSSPTNASESKIALEGIGGIQQAYQSVAFEYEDNAAFEGTGYAYRLVLKRKSGGDCPISFGSGYIGPFYPGKPVAPANVTATQGTSCNQITIQWTNQADPIDFDEIQIRYEEKQGFSYISEQNLYTTTNKNTSSYTWTVPEALRGTVFRFNVYAVRNGLGGCDESDAAQSNDGWTIGKPVPPTKVAVEPTNECRKIGVEWLNPDLGFTETSGANNWLVYKSYPSAANTFILIDSVPGAREDGSFDNDDLSNSASTVNYIVKGRNQCGIGEKSNVFTVQFEPLVGAPQNLAAVTKELSAQNTNVLEFTFNAADTVMHKLFKDGVEVAEIPAKTTTYQYGDAEQCVFNQYTIGGVNGCGVGETSDIVARIEPELVLNSFVATDGAFPDKIELSWEDINYEDGYRVLKGNQLLLITDEDVSLYVDENSLPGEINTYRVQAINACKQSNVLSDIGFADPNGSISGQVATSNGSFVEDVKVEVTPLRGSAIKLNGAPLTGHSIKFDNPNPSNYIDLGSGNLSATNGLTVEGWFFFENYGGGTFFSLTGGAGNKVLELANGANSKLIVNTWGCANNGCATTTQSSAGVIPLNEWVHLAVAVNSNGVTQLFRDGQVVTQNNNGAILPGSISLSTNRVGTDAAGTGSFKGYVDEIRVWEEARSAQQINEFWDVELRGDQLPSLKRYLRLNNTGSAANKAKNDGSATPNPAEVDLNGSLTFDDPSTISPILGGGYVDAGKLPGNLLSDGSLTISLWMKGAGGDIKNSYLLAGEQSHGCQFTVGRGGALNVANFKAPNSGRISGSTQLNDNKWHNIVYAYDKPNQTMNIYVDGEFEVSGGVGNIDFTDLDLVFGAQKSGNYPFKGFIDDISIWKYPIDTTYLKKYYNVGLGGNEDSLIAYWKMDEGADNLTFDRTENNLHGQLMDGGVIPPLVEWSMSEKAPVKNLAYTDSAGNYFIQAINYGKNVNGTNFTVTPSKLENGVAHTFNPQNVTRTLSFTTTKHDGVDFTDVSTMPISGFVKYHNTSCFVEYKEPLLDGLSTNPVTQTDGQGRWLLDSPFGIHKISIRDPYVQPDSIELFVDKPVSNLMFESHETYRIKGRVNGNCGVAVGPSNILFEDDTKCFSETITTDAQGNYQMDSVPPFQNLKIHVKPFNQLITFDPIYIYHDKDTTLNFTYREDLQSEVIIDTATYQTDNCGNKQKILVQGDGYTADIGVYEIYPGGNRCYLDSAMLRIDDQISTPAAVVDTGFNNNTGIFKYAFAAGEANLGGIGSNQYKKKIEVTVTDSSGRQVVTDEFALVEGVRKRASTFTTTSPDIMFFVLRDPPGDASYSYLSKDSTFCSSVTIGTTVGISNSFSFGATAGINAAAGWIAEVDFEGEAGATAGFSFGGEISLEASDEWCFTMAEDISTSDDGDNVGAQMDLYMGGALNYTFAKIDILEYDATACAAEITTRVARDPEGLATAFFYTEKHIKEEVIPALEALKSFPGTPPDTVKFWQDNIDGWLKTIDDNRKYKASAALDRSVNIKPINPDLFGIPFGTFGSNLVNTIGGAVGLGSSNQGRKYSNVSFGFGAGYESSQSYENSTSIDLGAAISIGATTGASAEFNIAGSGFNLETELEITAEVSLGGGISGGGSRTVGYALGDDDPGDFFSVNIRKDNFYKTPVFETVAGESSCPHEENTLSREGVQLSAERNTIVNIPSDQPGIFKLFLTNLSESEDDGSYSLVFSGGYQDGVKLSVNGKPLAADNGGLSYSIPGSLSGNTIQLTVEVRRADGFYEHDGIELTLGSECDDISSSVTLRAVWEKPCSEVEVLQPNDNWVLDQTYNDQLQVSFTNYDTSANSTVTNFELQFAPENGAWAKIEDVDFTDIYKSDSVSGETPQYSSLTWNVPSTMPDGKYRVRVKASCPASASYAEEVPGFISRDAPTVFGKPEPSDGVLDPGDNIAINFNENIDCSKLNVESMALKGVLSGFDYESINHGLQINGGTAHGLIPHISNYNFGQNQDFTVELWVKCGVQSGDPAIIANKDWSNGRNKGWALSSYQGSRWRFNIGDGTDMINVIGGVIGDNQWHHIAAAVDRDYGVVLYQDGLIVGSDTSNTILTINNIDNNLPIGIGQDATGQYQYNFTGYVDEFRMWDEFKFQLNILQGRFRSYGFDEPDVLGIWRFDNEGSATTFFDRSRFQNFGTLNGGPTFNFNEKAPISMENIESLVNITWTCAGNRIVIEPVTPIKYLENAYFTATVFDAKDMHGNEMVTPYSWTFYVDQNLVEWENTNVVYNVKEDEELSFTEALINKSGAPEQYTLTEIPTWLMPDRQSGTIAAGFREDINFVVDSFVNPGIYNRAITANTDGGFEKLDITVNVLCPAPDWYVDPAAYQNSMSITTELIIEGDTSKDVNDMIAAYVGDEVRGVASVQQISTNQYMAFLTIYSDTVAGENVSFRIWDASDCKMYPVTTPSVSFTKDSVIGNIGNPFSVSTTGMLAQITDLNKGWNWVSFFVNADSTGGGIPINSGLSSLSNLSSNAIVRSQTQTSQYYPVQGLWAGSLTDFDNESMYKIKLDEESQLFYPGYTVEALNTPISINAGWNFIGYPVQGNIFINTALSSLNNVVQTGDIIKSQYGYAEYVSGLGWFGSLKYLEPGLGYMLKSSGTGTLFYPSQASTRERVVQNNELIAADKGYREAMNELSWNFNVSKYSNVLNLTAQLRDADENEIREERMVVAAFVGDECRGYAHPIAAEGKNLLFLTIYSEDPMNEEFRFEVYFENARDVKPLVEKIQFGVKSELGQVKNPIPLHLEGSEKVEDNDEGLVIDGNYLGQNEPNPFVESTNINFKIAEDGETNITIYNMQGQAIKTIVNRYLEAGEYTVRWDGTDSRRSKVNQGAYYYTIKSNSFIDSKKMIMVRMDD